MATKAEKKNRALLLRWVAALVMALVLMVALAVTMKRCSWKPEPPALEPNPFTEEDFAWENGFLTCLTGESVPGIDVSYYQGEIDWPTVKAAGVEFAMIRLGYRGIGDGMLHEDEMARRNLQQARAAGIRVGAYFFSQALTVEEARQEAQLALEILEDFPPDLPVVFDWEYVDEDARTAAMDPETLLACVHAFCGSIREAGYQPMVYFNLDLSNTLLDVTQLAAYPLWFAMYADAPELPYKPDYWQYTDEGTVPGIQGYVDLNLYFP